MQGGIHDNIIHRIRVGKVGGTGTSILSNGVWEDSLWGGWPNKIEKDKK